MIGLPPVLSQLSRTLGEARISGPPVGLQHHESSFPNDIHREAAQALEHSGASIATRMQDFAIRLDSVTGKMRALRPDLVDASYDLQLDGNQFRIVDTELDERSRIWLEESLSGDRELVRLARGVNDEMVKVLDGKKSSLSSHLNSYEGLDKTIDRSVHFLSALRGIESDEGKWVPRVNPFARAGIFLEKQIQEDTYIYQAKGGTIELQRTLDKESFFQYYTLV